MFTKLLRNDVIFQENSLFSEDEVQYNLLHRISETENYLGMKSLNGDLIFAQTPEHNGWLWISELVGNPNQLIEELINNLKETKLLLPGISADPKTAELFADIYSRLFSTTYHHSMMMEAYYCPKIVLPPSQPNEQIILAETEHQSTVAAFLAGFMEDAHGIKVNPETQLSSAEKLISTGNLFLWVVKGEAVSMGNIAHRSPRHARINYVYTPGNLRKKGYASALVAAMCGIIAEEGLVPMLYADMKNHTANKIYRNIGFIESGKIADIKFNSK